MVPFIITLLPVVESIDRQWGFLILLTLGSGFGIKLITKKIKLDFIEEIFGLFILASASGIFFSWSVSNSINELLRYAVYFIVFVYVRRSRLIPKYFAKVVIISSIILSLISFLYFLPIKILSYPTGGLNLILSTFGHNHLAGLLLFALPISMSRYIETKSRKWGLLAGFFLASLIFTYSRIAYLIVLIYLFLFFRKNAGKFLALSILGLSIFYIVIRIYSNVGTKLEILPKQIFKPVTFENIRFAYWREALEGFKLSPVFGTGLDTFRYVSNRFANSPKKISLYAHNHFLQLFTETGIIGGGLFVILVMTLLKKIKGYSYPLVMAIGGSVFNNLLDYDWQIFSLFLYFWMVVALLLRVSEKEKKRNPGSFVVILLISAAVITGTVANVLGISPWDANSKQRLAGIALTDNYYDEVRRYNDQATKLDPYNTDFLVFRGNFEDGMGDYLTARKYFISAIVLSPFGSKEIYRELLYTYTEEAQKYFGQEKIALSKKVLLAAKELYPYLILIDIEKDFHSKKAIFDAINYVRNKNGYYKFQPEDISYTYNRIDKLSNSHVF